MLTTPEITLILIIFSAIALILSNRIPAELVGILVLLALAFTGIVTPDEALSGFASPVVLTLAGLFVISRGLEETGVVRRIAALVDQIAGGSEMRLIALFMGVGALLSLVMNNVAAGAVLFPAAIRVGRTSRVPASKLLIPLSFGTLVGGMATYFTTANIVMSELLSDRGFAGLTMLDFLPVGGLIMVASLVFMLTTGHRLLPDRQPLRFSALSDDLMDTYHLDDRMWLLRVRPDSLLVGSSLGSSGIGERLGLAVLGIRHGDHDDFVPEPSHRIDAGDDLLVLGREDRVSELVSWGLEREPATPGQVNGKLFPVDVVEVFIPPRSSVIGRTLVDLKLRSRYDVTGIAIWRGGRSYRTDVGRMPLQVGDALLVVGSMERIAALDDDADFLLMLGDEAIGPKRPRKAPIAAAITLAVLVIAFFNWLPMAQVMLAGAAMMVLTGCLKMEESFQAIEWRVLALIAGMLPLSAALTHTGLADRLGGAISVAAGGQPFLLIASFSLFVMLLTQVIGGQVVALIIGPLALTAAAGAGIDPRAMAVAVAIACSAAFLTPIAHPVNMIMMGPGGYLPGDFTRVGFGMTLVTFAFLLLGMVLFWGIL